MIEPNVQMINVSDLNHSPKMLSFLPLACLAPIVSGVVLRSYQLQALRMTNKRTQELWVRILLMILDSLSFALLSMKLLLNAYAALWGKRRKRMQITGTAVPSVDVVITCCNEDIDIVADTFRAALNLDYPPERYRIIVADDGRCEELERLLLPWTEVKTNPRVYYVRRVSNVQNRNKAGNLNNAANFVSSLPEGHSTFFAGLDADMIPERHWLRSSIAHLVVDNTLGFTCPAQMYYNTPVNDPLYQTLYKFFRYEEILRDRVGCALCTGSGWVMRRRALDSIGGFPTSTLTEDTLTANLAMANGWGTAYLPEALQYGLIPETYHAHVKQYKRWNLGNVQCGIKMKFYFSSNQCRLMSVPQRLFGLLYALLEVQGAISGITSLISTLFLVSGYPVVFYTSTEQLNSLLRWTSIAYLCSIIGDFHSAAMCGFAAVFREQSFNAYMAPHYAAEQLRHFVFPKWLGGRTAQFTASGSLPDRFGERHPTKRAPLARRLKSLLFHDGVIYHVIYVTLNAYAATYTIYRASKSKIDGETSTSIYLLTRLGWPPTNWFLSSIACLTPIIYALAPPNVPDRERLLERTLPSQVAYPLESAKWPQRQYHGLGFETLHALLAIYALFWIFAA